MQKLVEQLLRDLSATYEQDRSRRITPENVYQPAVLAGRDVLESFQEKLLLPGSGVEGVEYLHHCNAQLAAGRSVIFLPEHRGNLDVPTFYTLVRRADPSLESLLERLVYIAGRKLNESSDFTKMFTEKYTRLIIVPRRDLPQPAVAGEALSPEQQTYVSEAQRINRSAFRELARLRAVGQIIVLFPLGGREKPFASNVPVREVTTYLNGFDTAYPISMQGNTLPPLPVMEDERPVQDKVVFRVGPPVDCKGFLASQHQRHEELVKSSALPESSDFEQWCVNGIMEMLASLRTTGGYGLIPAPPPS